METSALICKRCKSPMEYDEESHLLKCPHCGYSELIEETDEVTKERIRSKTAREVELGKKNLEKEIAEENHRLQIEKKNLSFRWVWVILILLILAGLVFGGIKIADLIKHRNDIHVPMSAGYYCGMNYKDAAEELKAAGFENEISFEVKEDLTKDDLSIDQVSQITINGNPSFIQSEWLPKDSIIRITYHTLDPSKADDIKIPLSSSDCKSLKYSDVETAFREAGFTNIEITKIEDLTKDFLNDNEKTTDISVDGRTIFAKNDWADEKVVIAITYHALNPEHSSDVKIPGDAAQNSDQFIACNYLEILQQFKIAGFTNILLEPKYDLKLLQKDEGLVQSVSINGDRLFSVGKWIPFDSEVIIAYHAPELKYQNETSTSVIDALKAVGFTNIVTEELDDLDEKDSKKVGKVESVESKGTEFSKLTSYSLDDLITVKYHTLKAVTNDRIKLEYSSKDINGQDYLTIQTELENMGFTNITLIPLADLKKGWLHKEGSIKSITIDGRDKFDAGTVFSKNADIQIEYHSYE